MQEKVEHLYPFILPTTESTFAIIQLWNCVDALRAISIDVLRATQMNDEEGNPLPASVALRGAIAELNAIQFKLETTESEAA